MNRRTFLGYLAALPLVGRFVPSQPPGPVMPIPPKPTEYRRTMWAEPALIRSRTGAAPWQYDLALAAAGRRAVLEAEKAGCVVLGPERSGDWVHDVELHSEHHNGRYDIAMAFLSVMEPVKDTPPRDGRGS